MTPTAPIPASLATAYNAERGHRGVAVVWLVAAVASAQLALAAIVAWRRRRRSR